MKGFFAAAAVVLALSLFSLNALAQTSPPEQPHRQLPEKSDEQRLYDAEAAHRSSSPLIKREPRVVKEGLLAPSEADRLAFADFLKQKDTGLIRLLPREVYDRETYHTEKKIDIRGGGAYYSFSDLTHAYGYGSDIELDHDQLSVGFAGADFGILTNLGDVPLETITLDDPRLTFLSTYQPPEAEPLARAEYRRFRDHKGQIIEGRHYQSRLPVQENSTYLLRSIVYDQTDVLVLLRVARKDTDGSVIIAWKLLKDYPKTQLARN